jgi:DNA-binding NarL/FixJ family response regulator
MKQLLVTLLFSLFTTIVGAQKVFMLANNDSFQVADQVALLIDHHYTFEQILNDTTLRFEVRDSINPTKEGADAYWLRCVVQNPSIYAEKYKAACFPMADNTVYYYDANEQKWLNNRAGASVANGKRDWFDTPCLLQGQQPTTIYAKINVQPLNKLSYTVSTHIWFSKAKMSEARARFLDFSIWVTVFVVLIFFLYNAYIYYVFQDRTYFYYLVTQIGGIGYIICSNGYLDALLPFKYVQYTAPPEGGFWIWDLNQTGELFSILIISIGFIQLTRTFLNTHQHLPKADRLLQIILIVFPIICVLLQGASVLGLSFIWGGRSSIFTNVMVVISVSTIFYASIVSYRRGLSGAGYFLLANTIPLVIIIVLAVIMLFAPLYLNVRFPQLANIAIVSQAVCWAIALVRRLLLIRDELKQKQLEAQELKSKNELMLAENELHKTQNDMLEQKIASNHRELASTTLYLYQKNELLSDLKQHVTSLQKSIPSEAKSVVKDIESVIQNNLYLDSDWERFRIHFEQVHPDFFENLRIDHPSLTNNEIRLCAYFHLNLSTKEIAALLNIDPASVRTAKMRLNKKMNPTATDTES